MSDSVVARLKILLGIDSAEAVTGAAKTEKAVSKMEKGISSSAKLARAALGALGAAFTIDAVVRVTQKAIEYTTAIKAQAREAGVTTRALQEYRYAALRAGVSNDQLTDGLKELTLKIGEAADGSKSATALFDEYGISIRDANGEVRNAADVLPELADAFVSLKSPAEQARLAASIFGQDAGPKMAALLAQGKSGMMSYRQAAEELGLVISDVNINKAEEAQRKMEALNTVLSVKIATTVSENAGAISDLADALLRLVEGAAQGARAWRYWSNLDWSPGAASFSEQFAAMQMRDLGPGVELTDSVKAAIRAREMAPYMKTPLSSSTAGGGSGASGGNPWLKGPPSLLLRRNAVGGSSFGGADWSAFTPTGASSDWIKAAGAAESIGASMVAASPYLDKLTAARASWIDSASAANDTGELLDRMANSSAPALAQKVRELADGMDDAAVAARGILDRLFPEIAKRNQYDAETKVLNDYFDTLVKGGGDALEIEKQRAAAVEALRREYLGLSRDYMGRGAGEGPIDEITMLSGQETIEDRMKSLPDEAAKALSKVPDQADAMRLRVVDSFAGLVDGSLHELDRFARGIKSGNWLDIVGGLLNAIDGIASIFTGGKGFKIGGLSIGSGRGLVPGFASGGSGIIGGFSGIDRNLLSLNGEPMARVSRGEKLTITPANDLRGGGGGEMTVRVIRGELFDAIVETKAAGVVAARGPGIARAGSDMALSRMARMRDKALG